LALLSQFHNSNKKKKHAAANENTLMEIGHRICQGHTDKEIMDELGTKERTFYYYKEKLYQQSAKIQAKKPRALVHTFAFRN
jgi:hypothetical protein